MPESIRLLIRSADEIVLLKAPSWWNLRHTLQLLGVTAGALLVLMFWTVVFRRRLHEQIDVLRRKLQSGAVLEERKPDCTRAARYAGSRNWQASLCSSTWPPTAFKKRREVAQQALTIARNMTRHSMRGGASLRLGFALSSPGER